MKMLVEEVEVQVRLPVRLFHTSTPLHAYMKCFTGVGEENEDEEGERRTS